MLTAPSLVNGGFLHPRRHPRKYYQYALLDELDNPYAAFRYYYRTWGMTYLFPHSSVLPSFPSLILPSPSNTSLAFH